MCTVNAHKEMVRITFLHGADLPDPGNVFNADLEGKARRAIKLFEGDKLNKAGLKKVTRAAAAYDAAKAKVPKKP